MTVDEHVRKLAHREVLGLAIRLAIATLFAIPTFIFGIVAMSLLLNITLPSLGRRSIMGGKCFTNSWILFILATRFIFAADTFHRKAIKEIKSLWFHKILFKSRLPSLGL